MKMFSEENYIEIEYLEKKEKVKMLQIDDMGETTEIHMSPHRALEVAKYISKLAKIIIATEMEAQDGR